MPKRLLLIFAIHVGALAHFPIHRNQPLQRASERAQVADASAQKPCVRAAPRVWKRDEEFAVSNTTPPCVMTFESTGVVLVPDGARVGDIGLRVARDADGRLYTSERTGVVAVWSPTGALERTFGKTGQGPGEFTAGPLTILPTRNGQLQFFDNGGRWHVFQNNGTYVRTVQASGTRSGSQLTVLNNGRLLDASGRDDQQFFFNIWSPPSANAGERPTVLQRFGAMSEQEQSVSWTDRPRMVAYSDGDTFWAGPPQATGRGYQLEQWRTDGTLAKSLRRNVPWYPNGSDRAKNRRAPSEAPPHEIESMWDLGEDLLMVVALSPNAGEWSQVRGRSPDAAVRDRLVSVWIEVLDTRSGQLLAQSGPLTYSQAMQSMPTGMFNGTMRGFRHDVNADEERIAQMLQLRLSAK